MAALIKAGASLIVILLIGCASAAILFRAKPLGGRISGFVLALGLGFGLLVEFGMVSLLLTGRIDFRCVYVIAGLAAVAILYQKKGRGLFALFAPARASAITPDDKRSENPMARRIIKGAAGISVAVVTFIVAANLLARPMYQFDARAIYGLKAKIIFREHTIFSESVMDISRNHPHPRYPLLIPIAEAWIFSNLGEADDRSVRILFLLFFAGMVAVTYRLARAQAGKTAGQLSICAMVLTPYVYSSMRGGASSGYTDVALSFYIAGAATAVILWMKEGDIVFIITGALLAAFAAFTKNEGMVFAANLSLVTAVFSLARRSAKNPGNSIRAFSAEWFADRKATLLGLATYAFVLAVALSPWLLVRGHLPTFLDENYVRHLNWKDISTGLVRLPTIVRYFIAEFFDTKDWGLIWILATASAIAAWKNGKVAPRLISIVMVLQTASYFAVFVIAPYDPVVSLSTSLQRLPLHILPLAAVLVSVQVAEVARTPAPLRRSRVSE